MTTQGSRNRRLGTKTASVVLLSVLAVCGGCGETPTVPELPVAELVREPVLLAATSGTVRSDAGDVRFVDTHDHFAHTTKVETSKFPYFKKRAAAPEIALTFDCAWVPEEAGMAVLDALRELGVKSTFFVSGPFVTAPSRALGPNEATLNMVRRIVEDGHEVGNHTQTHPHASPAVVWGRELSDLRRQWDAEVVRAFDGRGPPGAAMKAFWRAPYGEYDGRALSEAALAGYTTHVGWNVDTRDALGAPDCRTVPADPACMSADKETRLVVSFVRKNPSIDVVVVLAHLGGPYGFGKDPKGLRALVSAMRAEGRTFAKLSDVLVPP